MIYVIYVQSGSETTVMYSMRELGYTAYVPRELYKYRKRVYGTKKSNRFLTVTYSFRPTA